MPRPQKKPRDTQRSIRVPAHLQPRIADAMAYEGFESFSGFCVSALVQKCRKVEEARAREERQKSAP